jgi:hypothetical protein
MAWFLKYALWETGSRESTAAGLHNHAVGEEAAVQGVWWWRPLPELIEGLLLHELQPE